MANNIRKNKTPVTVFLINGVKLQGVVTWFDNFCVLLRRDSHSQLVYKHAISTVMPSMPSTSGSKKSPLSEKQWLDLREAEQRSSGVGRGEQ